MSVVNRGASPDDQSADTLFSAFGKINSKFSQVDNALQNVGTGGGTGGGTGSGSGTTSFPDLNDTFTIATNSFENYPGDWAAYSADLNLHGNVLVRVSDQGTFDFNANGVPLVVQAGDVLQNRVGIWFNLTEFERATKLGLLGAKQLFHYAATGFRIYGNADANFVRNQAATREALLLNGQHFPAITDPNEIGVNGFSYLFSVNKPCKLRSLDFRSDKLGNEVVILTSKPDRTNQVLLAFGATNQTQDSVGFARVYKVKDPSNYTIPADNDIHLYCRAPNRTSGYDYGKLTLQFEAV